VSDEYPRSINYLFLSLPLWFKILEIPPHNFLLVLADRLTISFNFLVFKLFLLELGLYFPTQKMMRIDPGAIRTGW
jgi:hypothetical protein